MSDEALSVSELETIDSLVNLFEDGWDAGSPPEISSLLEKISHGQPQLRRALLIDLVTIDLERRWSRSDSRAPTLSGTDSGSCEVPPFQPRVEDYLAAFPDLGTVETAPVDLVLEEFKVRQQFGDRSRPEDYEQRFSEVWPRVKTRLGELARRADRDTDPPAPIESTVDPHADTNVSRAGPPDRIGENDHRSIGDYEILGEIARGGMGVVYKARHRKLDRTVALKMIRSGDLASDEEVRRFYSEAEAAARLDHPNIVPIYEIGETDGQHFFSMAFVEGESLGDLLRAGPLSPREAARLLMTTAEAVHAAHLAGIVHRDIKPANVLVDSSGQPRVTDFGLAKHTTGDSSLTATGQVLGTPSYMPPEQASGSVERVGVSSDVYSLGALLYALLAGRPPFQAATVVDTLKQVVENDPPRLCDINSEIPADLETICLKCLEKEMGRRYGSAQVLADELSRWLRNEPILARPATRRERVIKWTKRRPAVAALAVLSPVALIASVALIVAAYYQRNLEEAYDEVLSQRDVAQEAMQTANSAKQQETLAKQALDRSLSLRQISLASVELQENSPATALRNLVNCKPEHRGWEWNYLRRQCEQELFTLPAHDSRVSDVAYSENGMFMASVGGVSNDNGLVLYDTRGYQEIKRVKPGPDVGLTDFKAVAVDNSGSVVAIGNLKSDRPGIWIWNHVTQQSRVIDTGYANDAAALVRMHFVDDDRIVFVTRKRIAVWDLTKSEEVAYLDELFNPDGSRASYAPVNGTAISPDRRWLAMACGDWRIRIWDLGSKSEVKVLSGHLARVWDIGFGRDGKSILSVSDDRTLRSWNWPEGKIVRTVRLSQLPIRMVVSRHGKSVAITHRTGQTSLWNTEEWTTAALVGGHTPAAPLAICFSPDGRHVALGGNDGRVRVSHTMGDHSVFQNIPTEPELAFRLSFSPDGRRLAVAKQSGLSLWHVGTGRMLDKISGNVSEAIFSEDGRTIFSKGHDKTIRWWDATSGELICSATPESEPTSMVAIPSRGLLATTHRDFFIRFWDLADGKPMGNFLAVAAEEAASFVPRYSHLPVFRMAVTENADRFAAVLPDFRACVWDFDTKRLMASIPDDRSSPARFLHFFPDQKRILVVGDIDLSIRDGSSLDLHQQLPMYDYKLSVDFHPTESLFALTMDGGLVRIIDKESMENVIRLKFHEARAADAKFSTDGHLLASCDWNGAIKIWDGRPWTDRSAIENRALALLRFHWPAGSPTAEARSRIKEDELTNEETRTEALRLLDEFEELRFSEALNSEH